MYAVLRILKMLLEYIIEVLDTVKYENSPYYKGLELWDMLRRSTIDCDTLFEFKICLKKNEINAYFFP